MAEIVAPIAKHFLSKYLVAPIERQLGYLFQFTGNVENFTDEFEKLRTLKVDVQLKVCVAEDKNENILNEVKAWLNRLSLVEGEAQIIVEDKNRFPKGCLSGWLLNIKSRHGLSRRAKKITPDIVQLQQEGRFTEVSIPALPKIFIGSTSTTSDSRDLKLKEIMENLNDQKISMIGICGMGGVGKTTMVEEVFKRVKDENMFDNYAMTVVSQKPDMVKVQRDIAEMLGLKLEENNPVLRASRLKQRLQGRKVLIILDDVWEEFDLEKDLGVTLEGAKLFDFKKECDCQGGCKIVFTSRTQGLWMMFQNRRELSLDPLPFNESWNLFKENIGVFLDDNPEFAPIAKKIVKECDGLPLALVTLGHALLGKGKHTWNDTLLKLGKISGVQQKVYESIRQSYDYLGDEEAKSLFLLCSLFEEDSAIYIESLVNMGMGLRIFKGINNVEEARDRVFTLVEHLHSRCLLSKKEVYITVHDVVRDVSKSIASIENGSLVLEQGVTLKMSLDQTLSEHCTRISIISNKIKELPSQLRFPRLELLRSRSKVLDFSGSCFEGMVKLQVLDIICSTVLKLPSSLQSLTNLHTLCLHNCRLEDFTAIKYLQNLEILRITDKYIKELPKEIGQLTELRLLDMSDCEGLTRISPGIISGLTVLEELYLGGRGIDWGEEENEEDRIVAHGKFESLSNLHILHIVIKDPSFLPLFKNLKKYKIQIGDVEFDFIRESQNYERIISISGVALKRDFKFLLHHSEALLLKGESTKCLVCELVRKASHGIKRLLISETETPEYLANAMDCTKAPFLPSTLESLMLDSLNNLQQIINGPLVPGNFAKLKELRVSNCKQLKSIFRLSNAVDVLHLEVLGVYRCESMEEVIWWEGREEEANRKLQFPNLKKLEIDSKSLICFCKGANEIGFHQLEEMTLRSIPAVECIVTISDENRLNSIFPPKVLFPKLVTMYLDNLTNMKETWCGQPQVGSFCNLAMLNIIRCDSLEYVFSPFMATHLINLHTLDLHECPSLKQIVDGPLEARILVKLSYLNVRKCNQLRNIFRLSTEIDIVHLEELEIRGCESMEEVIKWEEREEDATSKLQLPKLRELRIIGSADICFCRGAKEIELHQLCELYLNNLPGVGCLFSVSNENPLKSIFPHNVLFPRLEIMSLTFMLNMKKIWCGQPHAGSFHNLVMLNIEGCDSLEYVFSPFTATYLVNLDTLSLHDCPSLKNILDGPLEARSLVKLKELDVGKCNQLKNIFRLSTEIDTMHLERLVIEDCESIEEVIKWEGREEDATSKLQFPNLWKLEIQRSGVKCFCRGAKEIEFHQLHYTNYI